MDTYASWPWFRVCPRTTGFAKHYVDSPPKTCLGTCVYLAPEVLKLAPYDGPKSDAWARPAPFASRSLRRALLTPQANPGSFYRCSKRF